MAAATTIFFLAHTRLCPTHTQSRVCAGPPTSPTPARQMAEIWRSHWADTILTSQAVLYTLRDLTSKTDKMMMTMIRLDYSDANISTAFSISILNLHWRLGLKFSEHMRLHISRLTFRICTGDKPLQYVQANEPTWTHQLFSFPI